MRLLVARRTKQQFAAHGRSGRAAHWAKQPCPAERVGDYRCVDDGFLHNSVVRTDHLLLTTRSSVLESRMLSREESAALAESIITIGSLDALVLEHLGAYEAKSGRTDELPSVIRRPSTPGGFVLRVRGCGPYRLRVKEALATIGGVGHRSAG